MGQDQKDYLINQGINVMEADNGTDTALGINTAKGLLETHGRADAKKVMVVLTDGMSDRYSTVSSYINAENAGITMFTILYNVAGVGAESQVGAGNYIFAEGQDVVDILGIDAIEYIKGAEIGTRLVPQKIVKQEVETKEINIQKVAEDDASRRNETIQYLRDGVGIDNAKGKELIKLDDSTFNSTVNYYSEVADKTYMTASGKVVIDSLDVNNDNVRYEMNLKLKERDKVNLTVEKKVQTIKVILSDGSTLAYRDAENADNNIGTMIVKPDEQYIAVMDDELLHGATIEITYKVKVYDQGGILNSTYTVYDYIDEEVKFDKEKSTSGWNILDATQMKNRAQGDTETEALIQDKVVISREFSQGNTEAYVTVTRLLAINNSDEYENYVEVINYKNDLGRRVYKTIPEDMDIKSLYKNIIDWYIKEIDDSKAELVSIIPPFGGDNNLFINLKTYISQKSKFLNK